jgi:hypothetical protein
MSMRREGLLLTTLTVLLGAAALLRSPDTTAPAGPTPAVEPSPPPASFRGAAPASAPLPAAPADLDRSRLIELPDGTTAPTLNGATNAPALTKFWGATWPWSPIVGVERSSAGIDWYKHADGSYSTTEMRWIPQFGRFEALTRVAHPGPAESPPAAR